MVDALAAKYGFELRRCLTGFKYIGDIITELADAGEADRFIFGFEESYGYLSGDHVRDKDAVNASHAHLPDGAELQAAGEKPRGRDARPVRRARVLAQPHRVGVVSRRRGGCRGWRQSWRRLRAEAPSEVAGLAVGGVVELPETPETGLPPAPRRRPVPPGGRQQGHRAPERHRGRKSTSSTCSRKTTREKAPRHCSTASRRRAGNCLRRGPGPRGRHDRKLLARGHSGEGAEPQIASPRPYAATGNKLLVRGRSEERDAGLPSPEHVCRKGCCPCDRFASGTPLGSLPSAHLAENEAAGDKNHRYVRSFLLLTFLHQFRPGQT